MRKASWSPAEKCPSTWPSMLTAESTSMVFFPEAALGQLFRATADVLEEILAGLFPEVP